MLFRSQVVCQLIGFDTGQGSSHFVDGQVHLLRCHIFQLLGEELAKPIYIALPEGKGAADHVFPEAGNAFVHSGIKTPAYDGVIQLRIDVLFIDTMATLVQSAEQSRKDVYKRQA